MSASSSNLIPKMNSPAHKTVADFVQAQQYGTKFSFDGERGVAHSKLCMHPADPSKQVDCVDIAMEGCPRYDLASFRPYELRTPGTAHTPKQLFSVQIVGSLLLVAKDLFATMQRLNFFCQLPQDPSKTHITCERIPQ